MGVLLSPVKGLEVSYPRADLMAQMFHQGTKISIFWNHDSHIFALPEVCFVIIMRCPPLDSQNHSFVTEESQMTDC